MNVAGIYIFFLFYFTLVLVLVGKCQVCGVFLCSALHESILVAVMVMGVFPLIQISIL